MRLNDNTYAKCMSEVFMYVNIFQEFVLVQYIIKNIILHFLQLRFYYFRYFKLGDNVKKVCS